MLKQIDMSLIIPRKLKLVPKYRPIDKNIYITFVMFLQKRNGQIDFQKMFKILYHGSYKQMFIFLQK